MLFISCYNVLVFDPFSASPSRRSVKGATINGVTYEGVAEYIYMGTLISNDNSVEKEIQRGILAGNRTYFPAISLFRSRLLSRATKIILHKTLSGFGGLGLACWPLVPKFVGSNPAEAVEFLGRKNPQHAFLRRGSKAVCPMW